MQMAEKNTMYVIQADITAMRIPRAKTGNKASAVLTPATSAFVSTATVRSHSFLMAQAFLGLRVSIVLNTGLSLEGKVSHIDSDSQLLTLNDGKLDHSQL
jgi:hypothetical protein